MRYALAWFVPIAMIVGTGGGCGRRRQIPRVRVGANLAYGRRRRKESKIPWDRVIRTLELADLLDRYPRSLSGGQQQRVALGRAILSDPLLLLLDEPVSSVELALRDRIADFIQRVVDEFQLPTLLVSHDGALVDRLALRVVRFAGGRTDGEPPAPSAEGQASSERPAGPKPFENPAG